MAALLGDNVDVPFAHCLDELVELGAGERADIRGALYAIENRYHPYISR